ncbi:hypothetical protein FOZ63_010024, partial [Perkinsus olseni]
VVAHQLPEGKGKIRPRRQQHWEALISKVIVADGPPTIFGQVEREEPARRGVFDWNRHEETNTYYQITYTSISKPPVGASDEGEPTRCIAGYSGFIPGKYSGNTIGTAFTQSKIDADAHLRTTAQAIRFGVRKPQEDLTI